jgi:RNA polymerase sigma factor (sigma-70 family)
VNFDFGLLYEELLPRLYSFALRMLGDEEAARDVAQETFAAAIDKADSFRAESAASTWLFSIAKNLCLKRLQGTRERTFGDMEKLIDSQGGSPSPELSEAETHFYIEEVKQGCLLGLLQCLPFAQRCVFILHFLNEVPVPQVAKIMEKSDNSIRILLTRARAGMRSFLCENCSLMSAGNPCSCLNMIGFSLKRDLISRYKPSMGIPEIKVELRYFSDEVELYKSLPDADRVLAQLIESGRFEIFAKK